MHRYRASTPYLITIAHGASHEAPFCFSHAQRLAVVAPYFLGGSSRKCSCYRANRSVNVPIGPSMTIVMVDPLTDACKWLLSESSNMSTVAPERV